MALLSRAVRVPNAEVAAIPVGTNFTCAMADGVRCQLPPGPFNLTTWVYDFGQNFAGTTRIALPAGAMPAGTRILVRHAEFLTPCGDVW